MNSERRIRNNRIRRQRQLRRNIFMMLFTTVLILSISIGCFAFGSKAQDKEEVILYKYYTNIEVQYGETLDNIAEQFFCEEKYKNIDEYISDIMFVNSMCDEEVSPGSYLIIPYFSSVFK